MLSTQIWEFEGGGLGGRGVRIKLHDQYKCIQISGVQITLTKYLSMKWQYWASPAGVDLWTYIRLALIF